MPDTVDNLFIAEDGLTASVEIFEYDAIRRHKVLVTFSSHRKQAESYITSYKLKVARRNNQDFSTDIILSLLLNKQFDKQKDSKMPFVHVTWLPKVR